MPPPGSPTRPKSTPKGKEAKASRTRAKRPENETAALVRYRNDGEEFHLIWTARRALRLLDDRFGLKQVVVEGVSREEETEGVTAGLLVVDTAEYFGDPVREVRYCQLKYSTRAAPEPWTVSGLRETLEGFAKRFRKFAERDGAEPTARRHRFEFVTNRPIAPAVCTAIEILGGGLLEAEPTKEVAAALASADDLNLYLLVRVEVERWDGIRERNWEEGYGRDTWCRFYAVGGDGRIRTHRGSAPSLGQPHPGRRTGPGEDR